MNKESLARVSTTLSQSPTQEWNREKALSSVVSTGGETTEEQMTKWDLSRVADMIAMFRPSAFNGDISHWDIKNVADFEDKALRAAKEVEMKFPATPFDVDTSQWENGISEAHCAEALALIKNCGERKVFVNPDTPEH